jgi:hypothetical protein
MLSYDEMKKKVFAKGIKPEGYSGDTIAVEFALHEGRVIIVADCGYYRAGLPDVMGEKEAFWLLENHPVSNYKKLEKIS